MGYDQDSGQVFKETIMKVRRFDHECRCFTTLACSGQNTINFRSADGAGPLREMATRKVLSNLDLLDEQSLKTLPLALLESLWRSAGRSYLQSARLWQLFAQTQLGIRSFVWTWAGGDVRGRNCHTFHQALNFASGTGAWLTTLTMRHGVSRIELLEVSKLRSLRNLHIQGHTARPSQFDDDVLRTWARAARSEGAFANLEMIFAIGHPGITEKALYHLSAFKKLDTLCIAECGIRKATIEVKKRARGQGFIRLTQSRFGHFVHAPNLQRAYQTSTKWTSNDGHALDHKSNKPSPSALSNRTPGWAETIDKYSVHRRGLASREEDDHPVLNITFGGNAQHAYSKIAGFMCFERCKDITPEAESNDKLGFAVEPSAKKRRLKKGRSVDVGDLLSSM